MRGFCTATIRWSLRASIIVVAAVVHMSAAQAQGTPGNVASFTGTPQYQNQWGLGLIHAADAYARGYTGAGVTVGVADTGFTSAVPGFSAKIDPRSMNFVLPSAGAVYDPTQIADLDSHGTHVSGIIAAPYVAGNAASMYGVAYDSNIVMMRMLGVTAPSVGNSSVAALDYFTSLANVAIYNASYGPNLGTATGLTTWPSDTLDAGEAAAVNRALAAGKIVVVATGNDRTDSPIAGRNPLGMALYPFVQPANANAGAYADGGNNADFSSLLSQPGRLVAVMAVDQAKNAASYSNLCGVAASWCVAAPGGDQPAGGAGIYSTVPPAASATGYAQMSGTSMATPGVSGALAVLSQAYPGYSSADLVSLLFSTTEDLGAAGLDAVYGYGLIRLDRATDGPTTLAGGSNVAVASQTSTYWSQPLTAGAFTKTGDGTLIIAGKTVATGDVVVDAGALGVGGTLTLGTSLAIHQAGTLAGTGTIAGNVTIAGTLSAGTLPNYADLIANNGGVLPAGTPLVGTSPGMLTFAGTVTQTSTAVTRLNVDGTLVVPGGPGTWDRIVVSGAGHAFDVGGTLMPVMRGIPGGNNDYTATLGARFTYLAASDGAAITGSYTGLSQPVAGLAARTRFDVLYAPTSLALVATPMSFNALATTANQQAVASALDARRPAAGVRPGDGAKTIYDTLYQQSSTSAYTSALDQMSGQGQPAAVGAVMGAFGAFGGQIADRQMLLQSGGAEVQAALTPSMAFAYADGSTALDSRQSGNPLANVPANAAPSSGPATGWSSWGETFGRTAHVGDAGGLPGGSSRGSGVVLGADRMLSPDLVAGTAFGFVRATSASAGTSGASDTYTGALYASYTPDRLVFDGRLALGGTRLSTARSMDLGGSSAALSGKAGGFSVLAAGEAGYRLSVDRFTVKPFVGLVAQSFRRDAFTETGSFGLAYPVQTFNKLMSTVGVATSAVFTSSEGISIKPELRLGWGHDWRDDALTTQASLLGGNFVVTGADPGRDALQTKVAVTGWRTDNLRVYGAYDGEFRRNATAHQLTGGLRYAW